MKRTISAYIIVAITILSTVFATQVWAHSDLTIDDLFEIVTGLMERVERLEEHYHSESSQCSFVLTNELHTDTIEQFTENESGSSNFTSVAIHSVTVSGGDITAEYHLVGNDGKLWILNEYWSNCHRTNSEWEQLVEILVEPIPIR